MSEPTIIYQSSETQYWYGEGGSLLCRYKPELWREGYSTETFGVSQHETELIQALTLAIKRAEAAEAERDKWYDNAVKERVRRVSAEAASAAADAEADTLRAECEALRVECEALRNVIATMKAIACEACEYWDNDEDNRDYNIRKYFAALAVQP